jgi:hypothetical protein
MMPQSTLKYDAKVKSNGCVEIAVPLPPGSKVTVFIVGNDVATDLTQASESSLEFWNHPYDDEDWNA